MTDKQDTYIYESPDHGDTVFARRAGTNQRALVREGALRQKILKNQLWQQILEAADTDPHLAALLEQAEIYYRLKN